MVTTGTFRGALRKTPAIICDLDGTLADMNGRKPYGTAQAECEADLLREETFQILTSLAHDLGAAILIVSGRFDTYLTQTANWLHKHDIPYDEIWLRPASDTREDEVIKREIYENDIEPYYNVVRVIDDRAKVIRMWRSLGLEVIDVGDGTEF